MTTLVQWRSLEIGVAIGTELTGSNPLAGTDHCVREGHATSNGDELVHLPSARYTPRETDLTGVACLIGRGLFPRGPC